MLIVIKYQQTISLKVKNNLANSALTEDNNTCLTISLLSPRGVQNVLKLLCLFLGENFPVEMVLYILYMYVLGSYCLLLFVFYPSTVCMLNCSYWVYFSHRDSRWGGGISLTPRFHFYPSLPSLLFCMILLNGGLSWRVILP